MVIYKDQDPAKPLKSVVIYNGDYTQMKNPTTHVIDSMTQKVGGFYQLAASPQARMTHLVGSGAGNSTERLWVGNDALSLSQIATNPFKGPGALRRTGRGTVRHFRCPYQAPAASTP